MGAPNDQDPAVQSLLKLKRYERPPEPYFNRLNGDVLQRLRGPEGCRRSSLFSFFDVEFGIKPTLFYGLGAAFCAIACYGLGHLVVKDPTPGESQPTTLGQLQAAEASFTQSEATTIPASLGDGGSSLISTSPVFHPGSSSLSLPILRVRSTRD